jgi:ferric-dicitrate binding protein FerR (iron transport regulator)
MSDVLFSPSPSDDDADALLARVVSGQANAEDRRLLHAWLARSPEHPLFLQAAKQAWTIGGRPHEAVDTDRLLTALRARHDGRSTRPGFSRPSPRVRRLTLGLTAGLAAAAVLAAAWVGLRPADRGANTVHAGRSLATGRGQRATLQLSDGSRIVLGPVSHLRYEERDGARTVQLEGEAYFDVVAASARPFVVRTRDAATRVLGTAFAVRCYASDTTARIAVAHGRVAVGDSVLAAGTVAWAGPRGVRVTHHVAVSHYVGWTDGALVFDRAPMRDVVAELSRWYDVTFRVDDAQLAAARVTTSFTNTGVDEVARSLALSLNATYQRNGRTITFMPQTSNRSH